MNRDGVNEKGLGSFYTSKKPGVMFWWNTVIDYY